MIANKTPQTLAQRMSLTVAMRTRIVAALSRTWGVIAYDSLKCAGGSMTAEEIADAAGDFVTTYGGDDEAAELFWKLPERLQDEILSSTFTRDERF